MTDYTQPDDDSHATTETPFVQSMFETGTAVEPDGQLYQPEMDSQYDEPADWKTDWEHTASDDGPNGAPM